MSTTQLYSCRLVLGLHQWVACYQQVENVFRTKNSMRYVWYGALKDRTVQRLPKHCVYRSNNTFIFNQQTKYTADCTLKTAAATTRAGGATEAVSMPEE